MRAIAVLLACAVLIFPAPASAALFARSAAAGSAPAPYSNAKRAVIAQAAIGPGVVSGTNFEEDPTIDDAALTPSVGPRGSAFDVSTLPQVGGQISVYTVHAGDTLSEVAEMFGVSKATITSVNDLPANAPLKAGSTLVILPISGYEYTVRKGDTLTAVAKRVGVPVGEIALYNELDTDAALSVGSVLVIPDAEFSTTAPVAPSGKKPIQKAVTYASVVPEDAVAETTSSGAITVHPLKDSSNVDLGKALLRPVAKSLSIRTQGGHGWKNKGIDLAAKEGTPVLAAANGKVLLARKTGWNDGYGMYVIILSEIAGHKVETIYAHLSSIDVVAGDTVSRGEKIGGVGSTGDSTGAHLHFEVRGALNPLARDASYTGE